MPPGPADPSHLAREIREQPAVARALLAARLTDRGTVRFPELTLGAAAVRDVKRVLLLGMGTAYHAAALGAMFLERFARLPAHAELATRWTAREPLVEPGTLLICVSQSGTTADTLAGLAEATRRGAATVAVVNAPGSAMEAAATAAVHVGAGEERAVASTKAFTAQVLTLLLFALHISRMRAPGDAPPPAAFRDALHALPGALEAAVGLEPRVAELAAAWREADHIICLGAGADGLIAQEGALKLKELTYAHAEGFDGAAFRHGPVAMLDGRYRLLATLGPHVDARQLAAHLPAMRARAAALAVVQAEGEADGPPADAILPVPVASPWLFPIAAIVPCQWLGYFLARERGLDVDHPRYLRKSLT